MTGLAGAAPQETHEMLPVWQQKKHTMFNISKLLSGGTASNLKEIMYNISILLTKSELPSVFCLPPFALAQLFSGKFYSLTKEIIMSFSLVLVQINHCNKGIYVKIKCFVKQSAFN